MTQQSGPVATPSGEQVPRPPSLAARASALFGDRLFKYLSLVAGLLVLAILFLILATTLKVSWPALKLMGWDIVGSPSWLPVDPDGDGGPLQPFFGGLAWILGSIYVAVIALIIAVPVSIAIGLFITEFAPRRTRGIAVTIIDLLAAVPSVVFGLWGILVFTQWASPIYDDIHSVLGPVPVLGDIFGPNKIGRNFFSAGFIVAVMVVPICTSIIREVFATVPSDHKAAALALGATKWEMIKGSVLPHSFGGITGAAMLGLGRALGETIAVALVLGYDTGIKTNIFASGATIPSVIVLQWPEASTLWRSALIGLGVLLFLLVIAVNYLARVIVRRAELRMRGAAA